MRERSGLMAAVFVLVPGIAAETGDTDLRRRDGRVAEGARLESVFRGNSNVGSNPTLSATFFNIKHCVCENENETP